MQSDKIAMADKEFYFSGNDFIILKSREVQNHEDVVVFGFHHRSLSKNSSRWSAQMVYIEIEFTVQIVYLFLLGIGNTDPA